MDPEDGDNPLGRRSSTRIKKRPPRLEDYDSGAEAAAAGRRAVQGKTAAVRGQ